jgi:predicted helicase
MGISILAWLSSLDSAFRIFFMLQYKYNEFSKYRLIHGHFHIGLVIIQRPPYWSERESRDDNQANMEMPM